MIFGIWFYIIREPKPVLLFNNLLYLTFFSLLIATNEELIFRFLLLGSASRIYSLKMSLIIQAIIFSIMHLMNFKYFWFYLGPLLLISLICSLMIFGIIMGLISLEKDKTINPVYPIYDPD